MLLKKLPAELNDLTGHLCTPKCQDTTPCASHVILTTFLHIYYCNIRQKHNLIGRQASVSSVGLYTCVYEREIERKKGEQKQKML